MTTSTASTSKGFRMKSNAPCFMASTAVATVPYAVSTITGTSASRARSRSIHAMPPMPGMRRVGQDEIEFLRLEDGERFLTAFGGRRLEPHLLEQHLQDAAHLPLVVDDQDPFHGRPSAAGSSTRNVAPAPGVLRTDTRP
jgi:hypothetical protein